MEHLPEPLLLFSSLQKYGSISRCNEASIRICISCDQKIIKVYKREKIIKKKKNFKEQPEHFYSAFFPVGDKLDFVSSPPMQTLSFVSVDHKWHDFAFLPAALGEVEQ